VDVVTGPLADAITDGVGSDARLGDLADADPFVTRTAPDGRSFRYHSLLRDLLARELARDPVAELEVHARAASWFEAAGMLDEAIRQALAGGDVDRAVRLVLRVAQPKYRAGEVVSLLGWIGGFGEAVVALEGDAPTATHWAAVASRLRSLPATSDPAGPGPGIALVSAMLCANGPERMLEDARRALAEHTAEWPWRSTAIYASGIATLMMGQDWGGQGHRALGSPRRACVRRHGAARLVGCRGHPGPGPRRVAVRPGLGQDGGAPVAGRGRPRRAASR
jgi:LuxR family maltose regulon positive regulatory protein